MEREKDDIYPYRLINKAINRAIEILLDNGYPKNIISLSDSDLIELHKNETNLELLACLSSIVHGRIVIRICDLHPFGAYAVANALTFGTIISRFDQTLMNRMAVFNSIKRFKSESAKDKIKSRWDNLNTLHARAINIVDLELSANVNNEWMHSDFANWLLNNNEFRSLTHERLKRDLAVLFKNKELGHRVGRARYIRLKK